MNIAPDAVAGMTGATKRTPATYRSSWLGPERTTAAPSVAPVMVVTLLDRMLSRPHLRSVTTRRMGASHRTHDGGSVAKGECTIVVLVPHPSRPALLTTAAPTWPPGAVIGLPHVILDREFTTRACLTAIEALLGVPPRALRIDPRRRDADGDPTVVVVDLEAFGPDAPSPYEWTDWAALPLDSLEPPELRDAVPRWVGRRRLGPTVGDPPWSVPGWFDRASSWMVDRMAELRAPAFEPPRIVYLWGISIVLRAPSALGPMYLKCSAPLFHREAAVTAVLAEATPDLVTRVAAIEPDANWLLMFDHGDATLGDGPPGSWAPGLDALATHPAGLGRSGRGADRRRGVGPFPGGPRRRAADLR